MCFDEALRYGEDVDLVWRLHDAGWCVRYAPATSVHHAEPVGWPALLGRRRRYGTSAAPLSKRHPGRLAPIVLRPWPTLAAALLLGGRHRPAAVTLAAQGAVFARRTRRLGVPSRVALLWSGQAVSETLLALGRAVTTLATPAFLVSFWWPRGRAATLVLLVAPPCAEWLRRRPRLDPVRWTLGCIAEDVAYGLGVWEGCIRHRTPTPLAPLGKRRLDRSVRARPFP